MRVIHLWAGGARRNELKAVHLWMSRPQHPCGGWLLSTPCIARRLSPTKEEYVRSVVILCRGRTLCNAGRREGLGVGE